MCRNIRVLHHFQPPTTPEEIRAAAEQYVRKVGGIRSKPAKSDLDAIERAVEAVANATTTLLDTLPARGEARTREGERERAKARWQSREERMKRDLLRAPKASRALSSRTSTRGTTASKKKAKSAAR